MNKERKEFLKSAALLVVPVAMQNLITTAINSLDVIMLGRVNEIVLAGASLGNQVYFNMSLFLFGITSGAAVLIAQYWGKKDLDSIKAIFGLGMKLGIAVSSLFALSAFFLPELLMRIFTDDPEIIRQGEIYLRIVMVLYSTRGSQVLLMEECILSLLKNRMPIFTGQQPKTIMRQVIIQQL